MRVSLYIFLCLVILSPLVALGVHGLTMSSEVFTFLKTHVLGDYILNSLYLVLICGVGATLIGVTCAWLIVRYDFFAKSILEWMLLLPMAFPTYIVAYAYTDLLGEVKNISVRSLWGAGMVMIVCLYPYVYLFTRTAFLKQVKGQSQMDAALMLGANKVRQFFQIILPNARPFIMVGVTLVIMEVLADYGTVSYFNIKVFSTGIYNAWAGYGDTIAAAKLSLILLGFVLCLVFFEKKNRSAMRFFNGENESKKQGLDIVLKSWKGVGASIICFLPVLFGFIIPVIILMNLFWGNAVDKGAFVLFETLLPLLKNTLYLSLCVSVIATVLAYIIVTIKRKSLSKLVSGLFHISGFGYALPGVVLALGLLILSGWIDRGFGHALSGSLGLLILGYLIRFWTMPLQSLEAGFEKISPNIDHATRLMRNNAFSEFWYIRLPLLWPAILSGFLIISVEVMKELPLTLILRPFNYNTLSIQAYQFASDERLADAALPSLVIVMAGLIPVLILSKLIRRT